MRPEEVGAQTSSILIAKSDDVERDDMGKLTRCERCFWFPAYQIASPVRALLDSGECVWEVSK